VPSCAEGGVLGILPGLVALVQATETVKLLTGIGEPLIGRLLQVDALRMEFREFRLRKDPACPACGAEPTIRELADYEGFCGVTAGDASLPEVQAAAVKAARDAGEDFLLLDVRQPEEFETARIEGAVLIPLGELEARLAELAGWRQRRIVVTCHHGMRSQTAAKLLRQSGFARVESLAGGIEAWSLTVDPGVPRY
jgi:adenylyltransferase/sulfurtransferase